ncbi:hypothetical protein RJ640_006032 [Escallonia rubra]|uniref:Phytosulfokine n=1 Tax=Escallonia rubra TaxID=112253 RepID=A0AA88UVW4_9ASTE|nr:hypothetical protein RJ640_006032 [Escallonia rubra]
MAKFSTLFMISLLLPLILTCAARQDPSLGAEAEKITEEGGCEGVEKTEECLVRKTLEAHVDYIYTQDHPHKPPHRP